MAKLFNFKKIFDVQNLTIILLTITVAACSPIHRDATSRLNRSVVGGDPSGLTTSAAAYQGSLYPLVQTHCSSCHGAGQSPEFAVVDVQTSNDAIIQFRLVDFLNFENSIILQQVESNHQGVATANPNLAALVRTEIETWALASGAGGQVNVALQPTYESINNRIFIAKCNNCHSGANPAGGLNLSTYTAAVAGGNAGGVNAAAPANTPIYARVNDDGEVLGNQMPPAGTPLTQEERAVILLWIQNGTPQL